MRRRSVIPQKPGALHKGARIAVFSTASPAEETALLTGIAELERLGLEVVAPVARQSQGYFAASHQQRLKDFCAVVRDKKVDGLVAARGGYGSIYLVEDNLATRLQGPKCIVGFSDLTTIQMLMWQVRQWVGFYGPMVAAGFNHGAGKPRGYDEASFLGAVRSTDAGWQIALQGQSLVPGEAQGRIVGGCLTLLQTTLGTAWAPDTRGAILLLEDRGMKPYQVDRALMHLWHAGTLAGVRGVVLGDFPDCDPPVAGSPTVLEVCRRILRPLDVPVVYGAPVGHTERPMLTIPLGVKARLRAHGEGTLEILEAAVVPGKGTASTVP